MDKWLISLEFEDSVPVVMKEDYLPFNDDTDTVSCHKSVKTMGITD